MAPDHSVQKAHISGITKEISNTTTLLDLLEETDKNVRFFATRLLTILTANSSNEVQAALLHSPTSITTLLDLVQSGTEMLRNGTQMGSTKTFDPQFTDCTQKRC